MEFRPPAMMPAFHGNWHLIGWIAMLIAVLVSPVAMTRAVSPITRYLVMSKRTGPSDWHANQLFRETAPLDILFLGNSRMTTAVDHAALHQEMLMRGVQVNSATIGANWSGYDLIYTFLTDYFARRRARLIVINYPEPAQTDSHPAEKYVRRLGLIDPGMDIRKPVFAATNYGEMSLVGFRLALASIIRPGPVELKGYRSMESFPDDLGKTRGSWLEKLGYQSETVPRMPYVSSVLPGNPPGAIIIRAHAPSSAEVTFANKPLTPIESAYLPAIKALCEKNGAVLTLMFEPRANAPDRKAIEVSRQAVALGIPIMAASLERMFGDAPTERIREHYTNDPHFNANGARQSAKAYAAALQSLLEQAGGR
jgi:hypothetical protein